MSDLQKVYVTSEHDARGLEAINEVFSDYNIAVEYVIKVLFAHDSFYSGRSREFLEKCAANRISERIVR